ncbi:F-box only protein 5 [Puntigrus tetrazona]|uniref:F-box only protein 5 n=1 Tax=Puntigrus tetrazona TaxID=1606681 RepID=UPI001C89A86C|nr:F-box only protein 5 [Puntigrus tetrazona]
MHDDVLVVCASRRRSRHPPCALIGCRLFKGIPPRSDWLEALVAKFQMLFQVALFPPNSQTIVLPLKCLGCCCNSDRDTGQKTYEDCIKALLYFTVYCIWNSLNMKCPSYSDDSTVLCHMEKAETDLGEVKGHRVSPRKTAPRSPVAPNVSTPMETRSKGPHNKENYQNKRHSLEVASDDEVIISGGGGLTEDSGYLSLQNSRVDHGDADGVDSLERSEEKCASSQSLAVKSHSVPCLPVVKFQEEVCRELAKNFKKCRSYDWTIVGKLAENFGLHNVIGGKMGRQFVDILCSLLRKDLRHVLARILGLLGDCDLVSCRKVSRTWRKIICEDQVALRRCREAERTLRDSGRSSGSLSRDFTLSRVVFSSMQAVASTPVHKAVKKPPCKTGGGQKASKSSRFQQFHEVAQSLKQDESLRSCILCGFAARYDAAMKRAACSRDGCGFEFCTLCQSAFHGSAPCRSTVRSFSASQKTTLLAGSTRSKRNVRRL